MPKNYVTKPNFQCAWIKTKFQTAAFDLFLLTSDFHQIYVELASNLHAKKQTLGLLPTG